MLPSAIAFTPIYKTDSSYVMKTASHGLVRLRHLDGRGVDSIVPGWDALLSFDGLVPFLLLEFCGPQGRLATWFIGPDGRRLADKLDSLPAESQEQLRQSARALRLDDRDVSSATGFHLLNDDTRRDILQLAFGARRGLAAGLHTAGSEETAERLEENQKISALGGAPHGLTDFLTLRAPPAGPSPGSHWRPLPGQGWRSEGPVSDIRLDVPAITSRCLLTIGLLPSDPDNAQAMPIEIRLGGTLIGKPIIDPTWHIRGAQLSLWLEPTDLASSDGQLVVSLHHPAALTLTLLRLSGTAGPSAELSAREVLERFENFGDNCEFGLVQRQFGAEPISLLRFAGLRYPAPLIQMLDDRFGDLGKPGSIDAVPIADEFWIFDKVYGLAYHTFRYQKDVSAAEVIRENETKLSFLTRKLSESLEDADKIFVYKRKVTEDLGEILALQAAMNRFGGNNKLLWVTQADDRHALGDIEWVGERLLRGYIDKISLSDAHDFRGQSWLALCRNALAAFETTYPDS